MHVVRYEPANMIQHLHTEMDRLLHSGSARDSVRFDARVPNGNRAWAPAVDVNEEDERYVITADIPGVEPDDIEITMEAGVLSIKSARARESQAQGAGFVRLERAHGTFERRFTLPEGADAEGIAASCTHGVLSVIIPKKSAPQPRRIAIQ